MASPPAAHGRALLTATTSAIGAALAWWHWGGVVFMLLALLAAGFLLLALCRPQLYLPVSVLLDGTVRRVLEGLTRLLLASVFLCIFIPGRLVLLVLRKDALGGEIDRRQSTYWRVPPPEPSGKRRFTAQF